MSRQEFEAVVRRVRDAGIAYGDRFDAVGNMPGPGEKTAARGPGKAVYVFDSNQQPIEIRHYEV